MAQSVSQQTRITLFYGAFALLSIGGFMLTGRGPSSLFFNGIVSHEPTTAESRRHASVVPANRVIATGKDWDAAVSTGKRVVFLNCEWNYEVAAFRKPFSDFTNWCRENSDYETITVTLHGYERPDEIQDEIDRLFQAHSIDAGGLKTLGGAGRILWFRDGRVVDYAWWAEVIDVDKLTERTKSAFR